MKHPFTFAAALLLSLGLSIGVPTTAFTNEPSSNPAPGSGDPAPTGGDHDSGDGDHGDQHRFRGFMLQPSATAPAGATGWAVIDTNTAAPALRVSARGLDAGTYTASVTSTGDGSVTVLGTFDIVAPVPPTAPTDSATGENEEHHVQGAVFALTIDPLTIASLQVATADGVTVLSGNNQPATGQPGGPDHEHQQFKLLPTADAPPEARGHAEIAVEEAGAASLKLEANGLAAGTYTVKVTSLADGSVSTLGTFDVAGPGADGEQESEVHASIPFPDGSNPKDVASVQVLDAGGLLLLTGDPAVQGGNVNGSEHLHEEITLTATADAPAGAKGRSEIEARDHEGTSAAILRVETSGLANATYTVSVTSKADGSVTVLGTFDVASAASSEDFGSESGLAFPAGFNPLDVASVQIADANGVVLLTGDFSTVTAGTNFSAKVRVTPGAAAPHAKGTMTAGLIVRRHVVHETFLLAAKGAPASTTVTVTVNGEAVGTVKTGRTGVLLVRKLPQGLHPHQISSVSVNTADGAKVLSAHF